MAVLAPAFNEVQAATLAALCEAYVPAVDVDSGDPVERDFMARSAADLEVPAQIEAMLAETMLPEELAAVGGLLDGLAAQSFAERRSRPARRSIHGFRGADPEAKQGLDQLRGLTLLLFYALPDELGSNPNWEILGYPGPASPAPDAAAAPKTIRVEEVSGESATIAADACVVGSGSGGSVLAGPPCRRRAQGDRARDGRLPQRAGLQPARAARLPGALLRRRPLPRPRTARSASSPARPWAAALSSTT